ncbi:apolipoprotein N-acyltransferase [Chromatium okenii]|uniref:Apolipoprotein N-acyltransferase n=1 Tax=Chromatium okenii TaxID=61644 RepID=A0A2S7XQM6_9GAMM|nr:apolipoprotein N-acyltransferase [Chromatium okenii]PQJ96047.1 apolipoprotein N-acyltransferase [Chromatium okenii]
MSLFLQQLRRFLPEALALASGALMVLGFAPFGWFAVAVLAFAGFNQSLIDASPRAGFWRGWLFGIGLFGVGVFWIRISLNQFGNLDAWLAYLLTALFIALMALYSGVVGWLVRRLSFNLPLQNLSLHPPLQKGGRGDFIAPLLLLPGSYVLLEWIRGWLFTGFPWLNLGYTQLDGPLAGYAPIGGIYSVSLLTAFTGGLLWGVLNWIGRQRLIAASGIGALLLGGLGLQHIEWTQAIGAPFRASVVQANIPQELKWTPEAEEQIVQAYLELTREHFGSALIVWPETALPAFLHDIRAPLLTPLAARAQSEGAEIVLGVPVLNTETGQYYNGLVSIGSGEDLYTKRHLVPFGEFMPLHDWLTPLIDLFEIPMADFSRGDSARPLLKVGAWQVGVSICYEDVFANEVAQALPEAQFLINVSNDAWFGDSFAPHQHLQMARFRALETGRFLLRATNTGISAIIDERGRVIADVPTFVRGGATATVQPRQGATPFVRVMRWLN